MPSHSSSCSGSTIDTVTCARNPGGIRATGRAPARLRVHRLRRRGQRGLSGLAGPTDKCALGAAGPVAGGRQRSGTTSCLCRHAPHAQSAHQHLRKLAVGIPRQTVSQATARRDRSGHAGHVARKGLTLMATHSTGRRLGAEFLGTAFLLATVIGSGIMGERLSGGNVALALLGNTIPTGAILVVLITMLGPISGAHFNPAVTGVFWLRERDRHCRRGRLRRRADFGCRPRRAGGPPDVRRGAAPNFGQGALRGLRSGSRNGSPPSDWWRPSC